MSKKANPTLIGVFTLVGLLLMAGTLILIGTGKVFEKSSNIILYFDQSANGLLIGSEVRFGGVRIGRVTTMKVLIDPKNNRKIIPVVIELSEKDLRAVGSTSGSGIDFATEAGVQRAVDEGLRAKMKQQSLLTGQLYIEFDIVPNTPGFTYVSDQNPIYPMVPTMSTEMDELIAGVADSLNKFNSLDLTSAMKDLRDVLATSKTQISSLNLKAINENLVVITTDVRALTGNDHLAKAIVSLEETLNGINSLTKTVNLKIDPLMDNLDQVMKQTKSGLEKIDEATATIQQITNPRAPTLVRFQTVLGEVERSSRAITELANDLRRNPDSLVRGKAPGP
jgi:paraquat-inducible protein B